MEFFAQDTLVWFTPPLYHIFDELDGGDFYILEKHLIWTCGGSASYEIS